ncbi:hypothetical protein [Oerskovia enterophila]|uniref:Uncharacterized protein n=1 Tax=Oerskovia enterophila TaxID=43678 RepID=A0ABX2Y0X7_9CELL|nr:hypothetical protein [Oerskovia enterophila]OCI29963.1 hypothetical protein OERS_33470 [Oerskovia enterophila]
MTHDGDDTEGLPGSSPSSAPGPHGPAAGTHATNDAGGTAGALGGTAGRAASSTTPDDVAAWRAQRTEAAAHQANELERRRALESAEAAELLREFVAEAERRGIAPVPLQARSYAGDATYRTRTLGWYLRKNRTLGVGTDASFYILSVQGGLSARLRGATLVPSDPPLVLGKGGRDGESISLADAIELVLERG